MQITMHHFNRELVLVGDHIIEITHNLSGHLRLGDYQRLFQKKHPTFGVPKLLMSSPFCQIFSSPGKLFHLSNFFPHHTGKISSANLQDFLNFPSQPKFPQSEGQLPPSGARTLVRFMLPWAWSPLEVYGQVKGPS